MNAIEYMVRLEEVNHAYDKPVLNDVNLKIRAGEFATLVGPSGCGKSTFLRLLLGSEAPNRGMVFIGDKEKSHPDRDCAIVFQKYSVFPHLTVMENVIFGLVVSNSGIAERTASSILAKLTNRPIFFYTRQHRAHLEKAKEILHRVGLEQSLDKYPYQLSGGMQQRVAIAQALIVKPKVLLMDEPFSALDIWVRRQLQLLLAELWNTEKMTIIFVTHDLEEAICISTRLLVLSPYWRDSSGKKGEGSKIMADIPVPSLYEFDKMPELEVARIQKEIAGQIHSLGFVKKDGDNLIPVEQFLLKQADSITA